MNNKLKYKKCFEDYNGNYNVNPELIIVEIAPCVFIDKQGRLNKLNHNSDNLEINSNPFAISIWMQK